MAKSKQSGSPFVYSTNPTFQLNTEEKVQQTKLLPEQQKIRVVLNTKHRGGKAVTLVENFVGTVKEEEELGKTLKVFCGTGGTVKDGEILIQGDNRDRILQWLNKHGFKQSRKI